MREWTETVRHLRELGIEPPSPPTPTARDVAGSSPWARLRRYVKGFRSPSPRA